MWTKKHFEAVAAIICKIENPAHRTNIWAEFEAEFEKSNPRFDGSKFAIACGVMNPPKKRGKKNESV